MDLFSLGFVLLILAASGFIAYQADKLGKRLGKKRLSVWGLRPKHVAAGGTVIMGVVVSFLTIGLVALFSRDVREWLVRGRGLIVETQRLSREVTDLQGQRVVSARDVERFKRALERQREELAQANAESDEKSARNAELDRQNNELDRKRDVLGKQNARLEAKGARLTAQLRRTENLLANTENMLTSAKVELSEARVDLTKTQQALANSQKTLAFTNKQLQNSYVLSQKTYQEKVRLEAQVVALKEQTAAGEAHVAELERQTEELDAQRRDAERKYTEAQRRYTELLVLLTDVSKQIADLQNLAAGQNLFLATTFRSSRLEPMTFGAGEELARIVIPAGTSADAARNALASLLRSSRVEAESRGAKGGKSRGREFGVADVLDRADPKTNAEISADDLKRAVVTRATDRKEEQVLVATSSYNAFAGEPVSLEVSVLPNPVVYHRNELVAEAQINGERSETEILDQLSEFLRSRLRERAKSDHMIARSGADAPYGKVPPADVLGLVRDVKRAGRSVRVQAYAGEETRAADPLKLEFRLK